MFGLLGSAGSGKSLQGQTLAQKYGWRWLSVGELLRGQHDAELEKIMLQGGLVDDELVVRLMHAAMAEAEAKGQAVVLDGYPRDEWQAQWLVEQGDAQKLRGMIVLRVSDDELWRRLEERGRADDTRESIEKRWQIFRNTIARMRNILSEAGVAFVEVDGEGAIETVTKRIEAVLKDWELIKE